MSAPSTLIVGGGVAGLASAFGLALRGTGQVTVIERETQLGFWSSGRNAGILRSAIHAPITRRLALKSEARFHELPIELTRHAPGPIFDPVGLVLIEGGHGLPLPLWLPDLEQLDACSPLGESELHARVPFYSPEGTRAWWMPRAGRIFVSHLMSALEGACRSMGVRFCLESRVEHLVRDGAGQVTGVHLQSGNVLEGDRVLLAPGAFVAPFAQSLGLDFPARTSRRHLFYALPSRAWKQADPVVWDDAAGFYFLGTDAGQVLFSLCDGDDADPEHLMPDPLLGRLAERRLTASLPGLGPFEWKRSLVGIRTVSEDDVPVLGRHPGQANLYWVAALGGHGITLSLALAEVVADLLTGTPLAQDWANGLAFDSPERAFEAVRKYPAL